MGRRVVMRILKVFNLIPHSLIFIYFYFYY